MANPEKGKGSKAPSRAASLQRMLEMERKQKVRRDAKSNKINSILLQTHEFSDPCVSFPMQMERMQQNPYAAGPSRRSESPASHPKSNMLARRRDSSQPPDDHRRSSTVRNYSLPPLSVQTKPSSYSRTHQDRPDRPAKHTQPKKMPPLKESRKGSADRDGLPSVKRAAAEHGSSQAKTVTFLPSDDGKSETSSICHSPTWDDYGKRRRREKEGTTREARSAKKRLTKEPPPAAMDNRPGMNPRIMSAPLSSRTSLEDKTTSDQPHLDLRSPTSRPQPLVPPSRTGPVESVPTVTKSPAFIGGVRLERERDAALRRLKESRTHPGERPGFEMLQDNQPSRSLTEPTKRRETAPSTSYPPTASKTPFLKQAPSGKGHSRKRSGSFSGVVSKLFGSSKSQDSRPPPERRGSEDSVQTVRSLLSLSRGSRGRQRSGSATPQAQSRAQSRDNNHNRSMSTPIDERRGAINLPPLSWKNSRKNKTTSMIAIPPNSAREGSFPRDNSGAEQDNLSFLERPFSPSADSPLSPSGSLSASMKTKMSPGLPPGSGAGPPSPSTRKTFRETIKAGFRSSLSTDSRPAHRRTPSDEMFVVELESAPILSRESHPLQSHPVIRPHTTDRPPSSSRGPRRSDEHHTGRKPPALADHKDSGASSSSSHPDSGSAPPSPSTTPDTSRPQSSKDNHNLRAEDLRNIPFISFHTANTPAAQHPPATAIGSSSNFSTQATSQQGNAERPKGSSRESVSQQTAYRSNFIEDLPGQSLFSDEIWSRSKTPLDPDQLSFTSALTSLDVKRSFQDLGRTNPDAGPFFSLDREYKTSSADANNTTTTTTTTKATKVTLKRIQVEVTKNPAYAKKQATPEEVSPVSTTDTSFLPSPPHQALSPRTSGRPGQVLLPPAEFDQQRPSSSSHAQADSPGSSLFPAPIAPSTYLQEARKAAPTAKTPSSSSNNDKTHNDNNSSNNNNTPLQGTTTSRIGLTTPRAFALARPTPAAPLLPQLTPSGGPAVPNARHSILDTTGLKPIAKMFVECCHCKFYQDMPSRVYEAMARPEDTVRDKRLGVSGQVTTCVKCPWCSHNMSTQCCAGYAAVVYLREKLHGP